MANFVTAVQKIGSQVGKDVLGVLLVLVSLVLEGVGGPAIQGLGGVEALAFATVWSGLLLVLTNPVSLTGQKRSFWLSLIGLGATSASITVCYSSAQRTLSLGMLVPIMGSGIVLLLIRQGWISSSGWRRLLMLVPAIAILSGLGVYFVTNWTYVNPIGIAFAIAGAAFIGVFTMLFQHTAKKSDGMPILSAATLLAGVILLFWTQLTVGHFTVLKPDKFFEIGGWSVVWYLAPTLLKKWSAERLSGVVYAALQASGSPIALLVQVLFLKQGAVTGLIVANLLIGAGGVFAPVLDKLFADHPKPVSRAIEEEEVAPPSDNADNLDRVPTESETGASEKVAGAPIAEELESAVKQAIEEIREESIRAYLKKPGYLAQLTRASLGEKIEKYARESIASVIGQLGEEWNNTRNDM